MRLCCAVSQGRGQAGPSAGAGGRGSCLATAAACLEGDITLRKAAAAAAAAEHSTAQHSTAQRLRRQQGSSSSSAGQTSAAHR